MKMLRMLKGTLRYTMSKRFPHSGNYPSSEGNPRDKLVQWSHGATGMALTLCKASKVSKAQNNCIVLSVDSNTYRNI